MGNTKGSPHKAGYFREQLEKNIFKSEKLFAEWVTSNYTDAVKELGKLQPKNLTVAGDADNPLTIIERVIVGKTPD